MNSAAARASDARREHPLRMRPHGRPEFGGESVENGPPPREEADLGAARRVMPRQRGADAAAGAGDEYVQLFGRSARDLTISASITGSIAACVPTFSVETTNLPSMTMSGTDCVLNVLAC